LNVSVFLERLIGIYVSSPDPREALVFHENPQHYCLPDSFLHRLYCSTET
jgi:hypothetical protein